MNLDLSKIVDVEVENINYKDYPDFSDAYISRAFLGYPSGGSRELSEGELDWLNQQATFVYEQIEKAIY